MVDAPAPRPRVQPTLSTGKQVLFAAVSVLALLLVIEGSFRLYHWVRNLGSTETPAHGYVRDDAQAGYVLIPGYNQGGVRVNSLGFRGPEITLLKPSGIYRIATLGDSATWGPTETECAYPFVLAERLRGQSVQVVNAAIEGYRSDRALVHLRRDVLPLQPNLVTVFIGWNDLFQTDPAAESERLGVQRSPLEMLLSMSDAAQTFRRLYFLRFQGERANVSGLTPQQQAMLAGYRPQGYAGRLREIFRTARSGGASVVVLTWPTILADVMSKQALAKVHYPWYSDDLGGLKTLYADYQETLLRVAAEMNVPVVDAAADFNALADKAALFKDTAHFDCQGQSLIADALAARLQSGLIPAR